MSEQYTPTTAEMLDAWAVWRRPLIERDGWFPTVASLREVSDAEFDRWLAEVERAAAEEAWWEACLRIADGESNLDIAHVYQKQNPYLEEIPNE